MKTTLRRIGNSQGVLIPAPLLVECGITDEIDLRIEGSRIVIEPVRRVRAGWFSAYRVDDDVNAWANLSPESDSGDWTW